MIGLKKQVGMTLLELLIATAVLSIMAGMGFVGVNVMMEASIRIDKKERQRSKSRNTFLGSCSASVEIVFIL